MESLLERDMMAGLSAVVGHRSAQKLQERESVTMHKLGRAIVRRDRVWELALTFGGV
jgi:hypothetical protein